MSLIRVLIFPCGAENALELHASLACCVNIEVWGASSRDDHGRYVFRNYVNGIPYIQEAEFLTAFNKVLRERQIDVVFPTHDTVGWFFAEHRKEIACRVVMSDNETARICREKKRTYRVFGDCGFAPRLYPALDAVERFPLFLKPNIGEGGKGTRLVRTAAEAAHAIALQPDLLLVEYLPGREFTIDCFTDRHRKLRFAGPRERARIQYGISVNARSVPLTSEIREIAEEINRRLGFRGLWFFQAKESAEGRLKLLEISTRAAGTMCLYRQGGVNLPLLSVYDALDLDVEVLLNDYPIEVDRALFNRFRLGLEYSSIYLDFDDTLLCRGQVNPYVLLLLYQSAREGKAVHLLTRHVGDIHQALADARIHPGLFAEIRRLGPQEEKYKAIKPGARAIFIDNAFSERKKVKQHTGIPVLDVDAVPCLLDWRA